MENYPGNSNKSKQAAEKKAEKKVEKVVTGEVIQRKQPLGKRMKETFFGGETQGVGTYVIMDVMIPAAKEMLADSAREAVERVLFPDSVGRRRPRGRSGNGHVSYNRMSDPRGRAGRADEPRSLSKRSRATHDFGEIVLESIGEANDVLERLTDLIDHYDVATINDFYTLVGITGTFTDDRFGWTDLRYANVERARGGGYIIDFPRPEAID